ncbi:MAG: DUF3418 domain-containing protein, partial [Microthrixaceae bacterium]
LDVPLLLLDRGEEARREWQVPGLRGELVAALVRALPKDQRRQVGPAPEAIADLRETVGPDDGPILAVVGRALARRAGVAISWPSDVLDHLPAHLRATYRVVDDRGRALAWSKDLAALRARMAERQREALAAAAPITEVEGLRSWTIGTIARTVEVRHGGTSVTGHPALVDAGDAVALRVMATEGEQRAAMWAGTRRLLLLQLGSPLRTLDRALSNAAKLALAASERMSAAEVYSAVALATVDHLLLAAGGPAWDEGAFDVLLASVKARFASTAAGAATEVSEVLAGISRIEARLGGMLAPSLDATVLDVRAHLDRLQHAGWIGAAGVDGLADVGRFVAAIEHRLDKAVESPDRDSAKLVPIQALEREYRQVASRDVDGSLRWMLEELRVVTFAQAIGAKGSPSEQKVRRALAAL